MKTGRETARESEGDEQREVSPEVERREIVSETTHGMQKTD